MCAAIVPRFFVDFFLFFSFDNPRKRLIQKHGNDRHADALNHIEGHHRPEGKAPRACDMGIYLGAHGDYGLQRSAEKLGKLGYEVHGVEHAAENRHKGRARKQRYDGVGSCLFEVIYDRGRNYHRTADEKVGEVAHKGGGRALEHQLYKDLDQLDNRSGHRAHGKGPDEHRHLAEIRLVKGGSDDRDGEFKKHQQSRGRRQHGAGGRAAGGAHSDEAALQNCALRQQRKADYGRRRHDAHQNKGEIFSQGLKQFVHFSGSFHVYLQKNGSDKKSEFR